ncbi:MAG: hypothetical protein KKC20_08060, partial [Proteobacteria bacterium]|nr:hypothetical protein [Pseudomonadota bacterium]
MTIERNHIFFKGKVPVNTRPSPPVVFSGAAAPPDLGLFRNLNAHIAVLDGAGIVAGENRPWHEFVPGACEDFAGFCPGAHYMASHMKRAPGVQAFAAIAPGIQKIMAGDSDRFDLIYAINSENGD